MFRGEWSQSAGEDINLTFLKEMIYNIHQTDIEGSGMKSNIFGKYHKFIFAPLFAVILLAIIIVLYSLNVFQFFELKLLDFRFRFFNQENPVTKEIVYIDVDEESLENLSPFVGQWPWPRGQIISQLLIEYVLVGDPAVFLPDFLYSEYTSKGLDDPISEEDWILLETTLFSAGRVSQSVMFYEERDLETPVTLPGFMDRNFSIEVDDALSQQEFYPYNAVTIPFIDLAANSDQLHSVTHREDMDAISRKTNIIMKYNDKYYPSLSLVALDKKLGIQKYSLVGKDLVLETDSRGTVTIPDLESGSLNINFYKDIYKFESYQADEIIKSAAAFFSGNDAEVLVSPGIFRNKIVVFGASAQALYDIKTTPMGSDFPGPFMHITAISNILENHYLTRLPDSFSILLIIISVFVIILTTTFMKSGILKTIAGFTWIALQLGASMFFFKNNGMVLDVATTMIASLLAYFGALIYLSMTEAQDKKFLKDTFSSYLAPELIDDMFDNKMMPSLGGESRQITAYFTDIQSFSTFSEKLTAVQLVELLNEYLSAMTDILLEEQGTLDKYEGDAIIAFVGAPMDVPDHPLRACRIAIGMQNKLLELREKWSAEVMHEDEEHRNSKNLPPEEWAPGEKWPRIVHKMLMRIGINTGEIVVGNMGSSVRMNYTMMGDSVNLAARLEAGAKQYGVYTMASEFTLDYPIVIEDGTTRRVKDFIEYRFIDKIVVVGKSEPVQVFEVVAMKGDLNQKEQKLFTLFNEGIELYLARKWDEAAVKFREAEQYERVPEGKTTPSAVYIYRCDHMKKNPPGDEWDGRWILTSK
jgi:adenylate cyclase